METQARPVKVVTDSSADIPQDIAAELDIIVVPQLVHIGGKTFRSGVDLEPEQFYRELAATRSVTTTSFASLDGFAQAYISVIERGCDVCGVHLGSKLSGTYNAALMASTADGVMPDAVSVVDSRGVSMAQGWVAIVAAEAARDGKSLAEVTAVAENAANRNLLFAALDTLEFAMKSGRLNRFPGTVGTMLSVKPILTLRPNGELAVAERVRTRSRSLEHMVQMACEHGPLERVAVMHAADFDAAEHVKQMMLEQGVSEPIMVALVGPVLGAHAGPRAVGVCALRAGE
jgi:DegV family protein with EDD domain